MLVFCGGFGVGVWCILYQCSVGNLYGRKPSLHRRKYWHLKPNIDSVIYIRKFLVILHCTGNTHKYVKMSTNKHIITPSCRLIRKKSFLGDPLGIIFVSVIWLNTAVCVRALFPTLVRNLPSNNLSVGAEK